jgi:monoamine oxidase
LLNKIVLKFSRCFWGNLKLFGMAHDEATQVKAYYDCTDDVMDNDTSGGVLIQFLAGESAARMECVDENGNTKAGLLDEEAIQESLVTLRSIFGKDNVPDPTAAKVTRWRQDLHSCGSYSFVKIGSTEDMYDEISSPLDNLLFAGEHTCKTSHSTVHGAWESGRREAERIRKLVSSSRTQQV